MAKRQPRSAGKNPSSAAKTVSAKTPSEGPKLADPTVSLTNTTKNPHKPLVMNVANGVLGWDSIPVGSAKMRGGKFTRMRKVPKSLRLGRSETKKKLPAAVCDAPEVAAAIERGDVRKS